jgi:hypothetical protein
LFGTRRPMKARNPLMEARQVVGAAYEPRVLEPSPPAVNDGLWFADDPAVGGNLNWREWLQGHPEGRGAERGEGPVVAGVGHVAVAHEAGHHRPCLARSGSGRHRTPPTPTRRAQDPALAGCGRSRRPGGPQNPTPTRSSSGRSGGSFRRLPPVGRWRIQTGSKPSVAHTAGGLKAVTVLQ